MGWETNPLEDLLPPHVVQPGVQVLDPRRDVLELVLVRAVELARLADDEVEVEADAAVDVALREPVGLARGRGRGEAELVLARVGGGEGEAAGVGAALGDYAVVVVEDLLRGVYMLASSINPL